MPPSPSIRFTRKIAALVALAVWLGAGLSQTAQAGAWRDASTARAVTDVSAGGERSDAANPDRASNPLAVRSYFRDPRGASPSCRSAKRRKISRRWTGSHGMGRRRTRSHAISRRWTPSREIAYGRAPRNQGLGGDATRAVLAVINFARTHPADYARSMEVSQRTRASEEAIEFLERQSPRAPLTANARLARAAARHAADQGPPGLIGHTGSDGSMVRDRVQEAGVFSSVVAEEISFGQNTADAVVRQWIVDEGVPDRAHRSDLFDSVFRFGGVACGRHRIYGSMCVIDLSSAIISR